MKTLFKKFPTGSKFILALILFAIALFISVLVNKGFVKQYIPYVAPLLLVLATSFLYKREGKLLREIGLHFNFKKIAFLPLGALIGTLTFLVAKYFSALYMGETFEVSTSINYKAMLYAFYFILPQVATEELLFRGYLFKKTIEISNVVIANVIFSILFMLIHVIDEHVLRNKGMIIMLVIAIPIGHIFFATALLKSKSLFFPIGLHLGNNWATRHLISNSNCSNSILYIPDNVTFETWTPFIITLILFNGVFLSVTFVIWKWDKIVVLLRLKTSKLA
ncbi:CPBP family intramembrane glutamic endopeptidase [Aquimarina sp. LLG6339-5]|uniref:CPBP family intramembrane glutamic endopeptidase n=1 Tax=Aquimarina sp. LLG6339-5 TaxID=3160830 RepID=UPI003865608F